jgi:hypothetical protein
MKELKRRLNTWLLPPLLADDEQADDDVADDDLNTTV